MQQYYIFIYNLCTCQMLERHESLNLTVPGFLKVTIQTFSKDV